MLEFWIFLSIFSQHLCNSEDFGQENCVFHRWEDSRVWEAVQWMLAPAVFRSLDPPGYHAQQTSVVMTSFSVQYYFVGREKKRYFRVMTSQGISMWGVSLTIRFHNLAWPWLYLISCLDWCNLMEDDVAIDIGVSRIIANFGCLLVFAFVERPTHNYVKIKQKMDFVQNLIILLYNQLTLHV